VQTKQKHTQKQSYIKHPLLPETKATFMLFTFGNKNKNLYFTNCVNDSRPIPTY